MFKRSLALLCAAAMLLTVGCNDAADSGSVQPTNEVSTEATDAAPDIAETTETSEASEEEHVLRILTHNDQLPRLVSTCYPDYIYIDEYTGQIGDMQIVWQIGPANGDWDYSGIVKHEIENQSEASAYDKIDLIVADDYTLTNYMKNGYVLPLSDIGITDADTSEMYPFSIAAGSYNGVLMAVMFEAAPVVFTYRRDIAQEVLGTDDPDVVAQHVSDMEAFTATAQLMRDSGYHMLSTADDLYNAYKGNINSAVISEGDAMFDPDMYSWLESARLYAANGYITDDTIWSDGWAEGMSTESNVFGYLLPPWGIYWTLAGNAGHEGIGNYAVCAPPSFTYWGSSYLCVAKGTDDPEAAAQFLRGFCFDKDTAKALIQSEEKNFANHMAAIDEIAASYGGDEFLGGQNSLAVFSESAKMIPSTEWDSVGERLNDYYRMAMYDHIFGKATYDEALAKFREDSNGLISIHQGG